MFCHQAMVVIFLPSKRDKRIVNRAYRLTVDKMSYIGPWGVRVLFNREMDWTGWVRLAGTLH